MDVEKTLPGTGHNPLSARKRDGDRRIYERLPTLTLSTRVKVKYGLFLKWRNVEMVDYHHGGFAFQCKSRYRKGQSIIMQILLKIDQVDIFITDIAAVIRHRSDSAPGYRYGAEFNFTANAYMQTGEVKDKLKRIEKLVKKALLTHKTNN